MMDLTQRQSAVLNHFRKFYLNNGYPPTVRKLAQLDRGSSTNIHRILAILVAKGWLNKRETIDGRRVWSPYSLANVVRLKH
jgi:SOS-response transcriptional repressor LexA